MLILGLVVNAACLVPPEAPLLVEENTRPRVELASLDPTESLFDVDQRCSCVNLRATAFDDDDDSLLLRVATNVGRDLDDRARCVREVIVGEALRGRDVSQSLIPANDLVGFPDEDVHTLSFFITDAAEFAAPLTAHGDCARIDDPTGTRGVVEIRWAVRFVSGLGRCNGCALTGGGP